MPFISMSGSEDKLLRVLFDTDFYSGAIMKVSCMPVDMMPTSQCSWGPQLFSKSKKPI